MRDFRGQDGESADRAFRGEEAAGELKLSQVALVVCAAGLLFALVVAIWVHRNLGLWLCLVPVGYAGYYTVVIAAIKRGWYRPWIKYLSSTLEVSAATIIGLVDSFHISTAYALTSAPPFLCFLAIGATVLRFRKWLSFYAGTLAAVESALFYLLGSRGLSSDFIASMPALDSFMYLQRSVYLFLAGLLAAVVCGTARRLVRSMVAETGRIRYLRRMFGRYVSAEVVEEVVGRDIAARGELRDVTLLCSNVRGFSPFCAGKKPDEVVTFLNALFERQCEVVERHGGRVDKFLGDGLLAVFGAPVTLEDHPGCAAHAALEIASFCRSDLPEGPEDLRLGVALHTGPVVIGSVGSEARLEYTVIGNAVNTAFRIEGLNKRFETTVLLSEETRQTLAGRVSVSECPPSRVRGLDGEVRTYELREIAEKRTG